MTELEASEFINRKVNVLLWKKIGIALAFLGVANLAALCWLFHNIQITAQTVAAQQAQQTARKYIDENLSGSNKIADIAQSRIRDMDRDSSDLYIRLGETRERLAVVDDARLKSAARLKQLNADFDKVKALVTAFRQESMEKTIAPAPVQAPGGNGIAPRTGSPGLSFDSSGNPTLSWPSYGTSLSEQEGNQNGNTLTFWATKDTWPSMGIKSLQGNGSTAIGYTNKAGASGGAWASFIQGYGNMQWVQIEIGGSMLGSLLCKSLLDNTTNQTSVDPCNYLLYNHNVSQDPIIDWSGNQNDRAGLSFDNSATARFSHGLILAATAPPEKPGAGQIYFNTGDHHFHGYNGTTWKQLDH